ncbi:hypothetical protein IJJ27_02850 [bacterium]|nr:hypothetical protein [bacterium]
MAAKSEKLTLTVFMGYARIALAFGGAFLIMVTVFQLVSVVVTGLTPTGEARNLPTACQMVLEGNREVSSMSELLTIEFPKTINRPSSFNAAIAVSSVDTQSVETRYPIKDGGGANYRMARVYQLNVPKLGLESAQHACETAANLEFDVGLCDSNVFVYPGVLHETLTIDLPTQSMFLETDYLGTTGIFGLPDGNQKATPGFDDAQKATAAYLSQAGIEMPDDMEWTQAKYMTGIGESLQLASGAASTDYVQVQMHKIISEQRGEDEDSMETINFGCYGPEGYDTLSAVVGRQLIGNNYRDVVVDLKYNYPDLGTVANYGTYLLKPLVTAWSELVGGGGYVWNPRGVEAARMTSVEIGYYEQHGAQEFLVPIYVFKGDDDVVAYVSALLPTSATNASLRCENNL